MAHARDDVKYKIPPYDGTPGDKYKVHEVNLLNLLSEKVDDRGFSLADHVRGVDEGGAAPGAPAITALPQAQQRVAQRARDVRAKTSYSLVVRYTTDEDLKRTMYDAHFQDGHGAFQFQRLTCARPPDRMALRELDKKWRELDLIADAGVDENTVSTMARKMRVLNGERPVANRHDETEMTERLLEMFFSSSKLLMEQAIAEYNAAAGARQFQHAAGTPLAGQRDFNACVVYYTALWRQAVESGHMRRTAPTAHQRRYVEQLGESYAGEFEACDTPHGVSKAERDAFDKLEPAAEGEEMDRGIYLSLMGKLIWPSAMTRPDISAAVSHLCSFMQRPSAKHYKAALRVIGYLVKTKHLGITYGGKLRVPYGLREMPDGFIDARGLHVYHDSSWGRSPHPMGGHVVMYVNGAICWSAKAIKIVPHSTCEAETASGSRAVMDVLFIRKILEHLGRGVRTPTPALGDSKATYDLVRKAGTTARTRYFERATLFIKRAYILLVIEPILIGTAYMVADVFTKATERTTFTTMRDIMMNANGTLMDKLRLSMGGLHGKAGRLCAQLVDTLGKRDATY